MTLVVGVRLSDSVCLATDTRVTAKRGGTTSAHDDCLKLEHIARHLAVACAGNVSTVQHLLRAIAKRVSKRTDPAVLRERLEEIVNPAVDQLMASGIPYDEIRCCLLFAGLTERHATTIEPAELVRRFNHFRDAATRNHDSIIRMLVNPPSRKHVQLLADSLRRNAPVLRPGILRALEASRDPDQPLTLPRPGTMLFGLEVRPPAPLKIVDAPWGHVLDFGSDSLKSHDEEELFARVEFSDPKNHDTMKLLLTAVITESSERVATIGGGVVSAMLVNRGLGFMMGSVWGDSGPTDRRTFLATSLDRKSDAPPPHRLVMRSGDIEHRLTPVTRWTLPDAGEASLWI